MDPTHLRHPAERPSNPPFHSLPQSTYAPSYPPSTSQPSVQMPFSDPFPRPRDPFLPISHGMKEGPGVPSRAWLPTQGHLHPSPAPAPSPSLRPPPSSTNGAPTMPLPYDPSRRRSLGGAGSPPQYAAGPLDPPAAPSSFAQRAMPPPSPPQLPHSSVNPSSLPGSGPRGPSIATPFNGVRDLATHPSNHRPSSGMSISSILGGSSDERKVAISPSSTAPFPSTTSNSIRPPSPGRARSSSMREQYSRDLIGKSPQRLGVTTESRPASALHDHGRLRDERQRDGLYGSPQVQRESVHSFRAFQPPSPGNRQSLNGNGLPGRPSSQPTGAAPSHPFGEMARGDDAVNRIGVFRTFDDVQSRRDLTPRQEAIPLSHPAGPTSQPSDQLAFDGQHNDNRDVYPPRYQPGSFGTAMREEQPGLFRPAAYPSHPQTTPHHARESIESRTPTHNYRRDVQPSSPAPIDIVRNGFHERPLTFEEHQRIEAMNQYQRKDSDGSVARHLFNISPELNRRGRNSPLPQAVQGVQPRHVGPGGDNPGIKSEFGRMFSGLGSGVGSTTPTAGQSVNGANTPSRMLSPSRQVESSDLVRTAVAEIEEGRSTKGGKSGKRKGRRSRDEVEKAEPETFDGRMTPSLSQRGVNKRAKTSHPLHHHHHHHHHAHHHHTEAPEQHAGSYGMLRFPSNPLSQTAHTPNPPHRHHHHHTTHAHPPHHHHHPPRSVPSPPAKKPTVTIHNQSLLDSVAGRPRTHLGSALYTASVALPAAKLPYDHHILYASSSKPIPYFEDKENSTFTLRIPRWYLSRTTQEIDAGDPSRLEEICKRRQVWGSDIYTDDSDVVAAAVHAGWIRGDFGEFNEDLKDLRTEEGVTTISEQSSQLPLESKPQCPVDVPSGHDMHVTLLILPPLDSYASTHAHHILSREWKGAAPHDGMSFMIHKIEFVNEGASGRNISRDAKSRKSRIEMEDRKRREAAAALLMLPGMGGKAGGSVSVGA